MTQDLVTLSRSTSGSWVNCGFSATVTLFVKSTITEQQGRLVFLGKLEARKTDGSFSDLVGIFNHETSHYIEPSDAIRIPIACTNTMNFTGTTSVKLTLVITEVSLRTAQGAGNAQLDSFVTATIGGACSLTEHKV